MVILPHLQKQPAVQWDRFLLHGLQSSKKPTQLTPPSKIPQQQQQPTNKKRLSTLCSAVFLGETIFSVMFVGKKLMAFSFTVNSHSRSRYLLSVFGTFSVQKGMLLVMQDNVVLWYCEIQVCWFLSFLLGKSGLLQLSVMPKGWCCFWHSESELAFPSCTLADQCCSRAGRSDCVPVHSPECQLQVTVNTGLIGSMKEQTAMGKNLAHIHPASLTTIWWLSAQVHHDQLGADMTYFERLL